MRTIMVRPRRSNADFEVVSRSFAGQGGLPMSSVLPAEVIEAVFRRHDALFGGTYNAIYTTPIVLWAFLCQVLADGKLRSCAAAVARIADFLMAAGKTPPSTDTGAYCVAREKLNEKALHELLAEMARKIELLAPEPWLWRGRHAKLVDGFTATMPDTPENQAAFPQQKSQEKGLGFPIMRVCAVLSLATACLLDAAFGPCSGKETGESALLREILDAFASGDVAVFDRYHGSYMTLALLMLGGVDACARLHQRRPHDMRCGKRLGKHDRLVTWQRPSRPPWMDEATYARIPETITLRMLRFNVVVPGYRTKSITVVTTLLDPDAYPAEAVAELYGCRWNVELDIRAIKQSLNLDHLRCQTPEMIRLEFWTTLLAYNLVRKVICEAAVKHGKLPRRISFTQTCATILAAWSTLALGLYDAAAIERLLARIASLRIRDRPGRIEPRVLKRRRHRYPLMRQPRQVLRERLKSRTPCDTIT
jgi:putative transposase